jgi:hypothetical protein
MDRRRENGSLISEIVRATAWSCKFPTSWPTKRSALSKPEPRYSGAEQLKGINMMLVSDSPRIPLLLQAAARSSAQDTVREAQQVKAGGNLPSVSLDPRQGSKLADALWSMENNGVVLD